VALINWSERYSVGVKAMDQQHLELANTLNQLHDAMMKGKAQDVTGDLLHKLVKYTRDHFAAEENMMSASRYPKLTDHRKHHVELTKQVEEFVGRYQRGEIAINVQLLNFLRDWLTSHIQQEDHEYGPWLNKAGIV